MKIDFKDKTTQQKLIKGAVLLVIIAGLVYLLISKQGKEAEVTLDTDQTPQEEVNSEVETSGTEASNTVSVTTPTKTKFNDLMQSGNQAFMKKDYALALSIYNEALKLNDSDVIYIRLFTIYSIQGDTVKAIDAIDKAIAKSPSFTDYWVTKLVFLDEKTSTSFSELKSIYENGLTKADTKTKVNLVTTFAQIAEKNGMKDEAITAWQKAIELYPTSESIYQAEINRLKSL